MATKRFNLTVNDPQGNCRRFHVWDNRKDHTVLSGELMTKFCMQAGLRMSTGGEGDVTFSVTLGYSIYLSVPLPKFITSTELRYGGHRSTGIEAHVDYMDDVLTTLRVSAEINSSSDWDSSHKSWSLWRRITRGNGARWSADLSEKIFGEIERQEKVVGEKRVVELQLPEGWYAVTGEVTRSRFRRPKLAWLGWSPWFYSAHFDMPNGIPTIRRKGDDGLYGISLSLGDRFGYSDTVGAAARRVATDLVTERMKYGGHDWKPREGWPKHCRPYKQQASEQTIRMWAASGQPIWYAEPWRTKIVESDLRMMLGNQRRYAGSANVTILQHLVLCCLIADEQLDAFGKQHVDAFGGEIVTKLIRYILKCTALHDLHEAYTQDIVAGLKQLLPEYRAIEEKWESYVHSVFGEAFPISEQARTLVKDFDMRALRAECGYHDHPAFFAICKGMNGNPTTTEEGMAIQVFTADEPRLWEMLTAYLPMENIR